MAEAMSKADLETETRVSVLETQVDSITGSVTKLEQKIDSNYATLHHRISDMRDDLRNDIDTKHEKIILYDLYPVTFCRKVKRTICFRNRIY